MSELITFKLPKEKKEELKELSVKTGTQMASLIRGAIYQMLEEKKAA